MSYCGVKFHIVWAAQSWTVVLWGIALVLGIIHRVLYVALLQFGYHLGEEDKKAVQASEEQVRRHAGRWISTVP